MKKFIIGILIPAVCILAGCSRDGRNIADVPGAMIEACSKIDPATVTPVVFVHGLLSLPGETFYNMHEKFASQGFPEERMHVALLPKIGTPVTGGDSRYAWYTIVPTAPYDRRSWESAGNTTRNAPALRDQILDLLHATGAGRVDLVGHSNGNVIIRELLSYANNPGGPRYDEYRVLEHRIRKVVFMSGFASVGDTDISSVLKYLDDIAPDSAMPADVEYYSLGSATDANTFELVQMYKYLYCLPADFDSCIFAIPGAVNDTIEFTDALGNRTGLDHQRIPTHIVSIKKVFKWLTGADFAEPSNPSTIGIGGRIIIQDNTGTDDCPPDSPCDQYAMEHGRVTVKYYDPSTGLETGQGGSAVIANARYAIDNLDPSMYFKIIIERHAGTSDSTVIATSVYFLADRVGNNCRALDFSAPRVFESDNEDGKVLIKINAAYSFLSRRSYTRSGVRRDSDHYSGRIEAPGCTTVYQDCSCLTRLLPVRYTTIYLQNFGKTDVLTDRVYNFIDPYNLGYGPGYKNDYASKEIYVTADLQRTGVTTKVKINGADRSRNINNYIMYLYRD